MLLRLTALIAGTLIGTLAFATPTIINYTSVGGDATNGGNLWIHDGGRIQFGGCNNTALGCAATGQSARDASGLTPPAKNGFDFNITSCSNCVTALGNGSFYGHIDDPNNNTSFWQMGTINSLGGGTEEAKVTGTGRFRINDGSGTCVGGCDFSGDLTWDDIFSIGSGDGFNMNALVNVTNLSYAGTNADLLALLAAVSGKTTVSFTFASPMSLTALKAAGASTLDAYSGQYTPTPEPNFYALLAMGLALAVWINRREKKATS
jgi:hypothetical protein